MGRHPAQDCRPDSSRRHGRPRHTAAKGLRDDPGWPIRAGILGEACGTLSWVHHSLSFLPLEMQATSRWADGAREGGFLFLHFVLKDKGHTSCTSSLRVPVEPCRLCLTGRRPPNDTPKRSQPNTKCLYQCEHSFVGGWVLFNLCGSSSSQASLSPFRKSEGNL